MATDLLRIEICALPLAMVNGILISFHYADEKFYRPTLAPIFGSLAGIGLVVFFHKSLGIHALAWGFCLNNLVQLLILALIVKDHSWKLEWRNEGLRQLGKRILPLTLGNIYYKSDTLVERLIASFLPSGSISYLGYGQRITTAITQVLTRGFITTRFTEMSQTYLQGPDGFRRVFNQLLERISYIIVPVVFAIILFSQDIIHFLLERGAFTAADTRHTALVLIALIGVVIGGMLGSIMANSFYAAGDTRTITIFAMVSFTIGIGLKIVGARLFSFYGIALATSLYFMLTPIIGFTILQRKLKVFAQQKTWRHCVKILLAGAISFLLCFYSLPKTSLGFWLLPLGVSLLFILYQLLAMVLHVDEAWKLWKKVKDYGLHLLLR
jgi:putative peptidoglycan lipid II flippase